MTDPVVAPEVDEETEDDVYLPNPYDDNEPELETDDGSDPEEDVPA